MEGSSHRPSVAELGDLSGRRALVAGGAGHIGRVCVETLRELGAEVMIADRDAGADGVVVDLADEGETRGAVRETLERLGGLDVLVHAAALVGSDDVPGWNVPFAEQSVDAWEAAVRVNLTSAFTLVHEGRDALAASGHGS